MPSGGPATISQEADRGSRLGDRRRPNAELRSREHLTFDEVERLIAAAKQAFSAAHPPGGGPFSFFAANFYHIEGGARPTGQRMNNFCPAKLPMPALSALRPARESTKGRLADLKLVP